MSHIEREHPPLKHPAARAPNGSACGAGSRPAPANFYLCIKVANGESGGAGLAWSVTEGRKAGPARFWASLEMPKYTEYISDSMYILGLFVERKIYWRSVDHTVGNVGEK